VAAGGESAGRKIRVKKSREKIADGTKKERAEARPFLAGLLGRGLFGGEKQRRVIGKR